MNKQELNDKLLNASYQGNLDTVKYLLSSYELKEHANINYTDKYGTNTLMIACVNGHLEVVKYLLSSQDLKEHSNINSKDKNGYNALILAGWKGNLDLVKYLIIDMNMDIDNETINWLKGKNEHKTVYEDILKLIEKRDLHNKLDNSIRDDKINNKKVKL